LSEDDQLHPEEHRAKAILFSFGRALLCFILLPCSFYTGKELVKTMEYAKELKVQEQEEDGVDSIEDGK
jgi:hypothetical protein